MPRLYLPIGSKPHLVEDTERQRLKNRLWELRVLVPEADQLELSHLRDIVQSQEHKIAAQQARESALVNLGQQIVNAMSPEQVKGALKEFLDWRRKRQGIK